MWNQSTHQGRRIYQAPFRSLLQDHRVGLVQRIEHFLRGSQSVWVPNDVRLRKTVSVLKALWTLATIPSGPRASPDSAPLVFHPLENIKWDILDLSLQSDI
ncbi:unnamed protein product, partial [Mycena citricolor]